jgi:hypothetical protein
MNTFHTGILTIALVAASITPVEALADNDAYAVKFVYDQCARQFSAYNRVPNKGKAMYVGWKKNPSGNYTAACFWVWGRKDWVSASGGARKNCQKRNSHYTCFAFDENPTAFWVSLRARALASPPPRPVHRQPAPAPDPTFGHLRSTGFRLA